MDFPSLLLLLLVLPLVAAAVIVVGSSLRRRRRPAGDRSASMPVHRLQADTAAAQDAAVRPAAVARKATPGRERRASSAEDARDR